MNIIFKPFRKTDFPLMLKWLEMPHVKAWWPIDQNLGVSGEHNTQWTPELIREKYDSYTKGYKLENGIAKSISAYIIFVDETPIGYIQIYNAHDFSRVKPLTGLPSSLAAFDVLIGEENYLKQGIGSSAIVQFLKDHADAYTHIFADPDSNNIAAIRAYEKAGFKKIKDQPNIDEVWMIREQPLYKKDDYDMIKWAEESLVSKGYIIQKAPEIIQKTPYSSVIRFLTSVGHVYLKQTPPTLFLEVEIMKLLFNQFHANVPEIIAENKMFNCFLMRDCGNSLRESLKINFQPELLCKGVKRYTDIQRKVEGQTNTFIEFGVPDWRLEKLPDLYLKLIAEEELLIQDGMTINELKNLQELHSVLVSIAELLSSYKIPETLDHCDFHDNNMLVANNMQDVTIIDWGETVVSHPFFALISFISTVAYRYKLQETSDTFIGLEDACFKNWLEIVPRNVLLEAMRLTKKIWPIYSALGYYRLMVSSNMNMDVADLKSYFFTGRNVGRLTGYLKEFIKVCLGLAPNDVSRINLADPARLIKG